MILKTATLVLLFLPQIVSASALVIRDNEKLELKVIAKLHFFGEAATREIAEAATREINTLWSEPDVKIQLFDNHPGPAIIGRSSATHTLKNYKLVFEIDYMVHKDRPNVSASCANNIIEIKNKQKTGDFSYYASKGSREAVFYTSDDLGNSTTAAHEFGHALNLEHPDMDQRNSPTAGIMFARGTIVREELQIGPKVNYRDKSGKGRLNPYLRKVRAKDIKSIPWSRIWYDSNMTCLGQGKISLDY